MRVMVMVKLTPGLEAAVKPTEELFAAMGKYNEELVSAGIMVAGEGLVPTEKAKIVHFKGAERTVLDGPFAEAKEFIGGYWIWQVESMDRRSTGPSAAPTPWASSLTSKSGRSQRWRTCRQSSRLSCRPRSRAFATRSRRTRSPERPRSAREDISSRRVDLSLPRSTSLQGLAIKPVPGNERRDK